MKREKTYEEIVELFIRLVKKYNALEKIPADYGEGKDKLDEEHLLLVTDSYIRKLEQTSKEFIKQVAEFHSNLSDDQKT